MNYRKAHRISEVLIYVGLALLVLMRIFSETIAGWFPDQDGALITVVSNVLLALVIIGFVIGFCFYRCPHCGRPLRFLRFEHPDSCHHCGEKLE